MKELIAGVILVVILFGIAIWWNIYAFQDCKKVGHSTLYCLGRIGK